MAGLRASAGAVAPVARQRPGGNAAIRIVREDVGAIDPDDVALALEVGAPVIRMAVSYYRTQSQRIFQLDIEDVESIARIAVIEAWQTFRVGDLSREKHEYGGMRAWMRQVVAWRLADALARSESDFLVADGGDRAEGLSADPEQEEGVYHGQMRRWLRQALRELSVRQRQIIGGILQGRTQASLAEELGVSPGRICQEYRAALDALYLLARDAGFDSLVLPE